MRHDLTVTRIRRSRPWNLTGTPLALGVAAVLAATLTVSAAPKMNSKAKPAGANQASRPPVESPAESESLRSVARDVDQLILSVCQAEGVTPAAVCDDATFFRRVWLDLAGRTPPAAETRKLFASKQKLDRLSLIRELLDSEEFLAHWARLWTEYLTDKRPFVEEGYSARTLQKFLRESFQQAKPYDQLVTELIQGQGPSDSSGPANFLLRYNAQAVPLTGAVSRKFLGLSLHCAECHDHPFATWKQDDFWGLAAYFGRIRKMAPAEGPGDDEEFYIVYEKAQGELRTPDKSLPIDENGMQPLKTVYPKLPDSDSMDLNPERRPALLNWVVSADNPYFARHAVNHVWEMLLGKPLSRTFDPQREGSDPVTRHQAVLDLLAKDFVDHQYNLKRLVNIVLLTDAYQRKAGIDESSTPSQSPSEGTRLGQLMQREDLFAAARLRPLSADQLHLSLAMATGSLGDSDDATLAELTGEEFTEDHPVQTFSESGLTLQRSMAMFHSDRILEAANLGAEAVRRLYGDTPGPKHIEWLYLSLFSRQPKANEVQLLLEVAANGEQGLQDAVWVLLNSAEFNSLH